MLKKIVYVLIAVLLIAAILWPRLKPMLASKKEGIGPPTTGKPGAKGPSILQANVYVAQPETIKDKIVVNGSLLANETIEVCSEAAGRVEKIYFQEGTMVVKGQLLVQVRQVELQAQLRKVVEQKNLAEKREKRLQQLLAREAVSQEEYDAVASQVVVYQAEIDLLKAQLEKTEIRAPFSGIIGFRKIAEGSYISVGASIASLQDIASIKIEFGVPEKYSEVLRTGMNINFHTRSSDKTFQANIYAIEPQIEANTRNLILRARTMNAANLLRPGAFADIELPLTEVTNALLVPTEAVVPELNGKKLLLVKNGVVEPRNVVTGLRTDTKIQITEGLQIGDTVLATGILQAKPGIPVKINKVL